MRRAALLLTVLTVPACALTEERFVEQVADRYCARVKACDETQFWTTWYDGTPECMDDLVNRVGDKAYGNGNVACEWIEDESAACLEAVDADPCDEVVAVRYVDACADPAWDCVTLTR